MDDIQFSDGTGTLKRFANFKSSYVAYRNIDVWLPPGYSPDRRCPVLYMHDGQNLFDPALASYGTDWGIDEALMKLQQDEGIPAPIVVGAWCTEFRWHEYMPQELLSLPGNRVLRLRLRAEHPGEPCADRYLQFLVNELKPLIDSNFSTLPGPEHTLIMGSSMGGLISLYAACQYPAVFGRVGCVSTHWTAAKKALVDYFASRLPDPHTHRLYFDYGMAGIDAGYEQYQRQFDHHLVAAGYVEGKNWITRSFEGADHSERYWRTRVHIPLRFLLTGKAKA